ncbi:MAG: biosynthetic-type acetolactate synthase large subunit [Roseburia sp.]|uniref:biosynthetic-type acetolactate synthase large subunit n=1 Tax=Roseburia sp. 831b TaxID=1261635 RepID=UPI000952340C|nr:biosynthetic-type acetolactate synthase large subunit [Roseburia sp. 831b]MDD6216951.1 biosynthetic-type acetolactate synthase large subunit [Roseburia sp.]MDY5883321.1 biosynthetic-type acetolactate synthase large subunit [Roseburia sp.]WVK71918.1 biosynthetic-type acetolactate synthase large subunit [Roseburia sp. 831b]
MDITGRKLFVKALQEEHVDVVFGYPGGTVTDLFDELYKQDGIDVVLPRHEQGLIHEAEGYAKSTGKVGVCLVTSGPGATNIITGLADAHYDNIPLVCFTGQVSRNLIGNDAFQEVDIVGMTRSVTKYGVTVQNREDLGKIIKMAFHIASTGKPGPVLVDLPKDIQVEAGPAEYPQHVQIRGYKPNETVHIGQLKKAYKLLKSAKKPLILAGGGVNIAKANDLMRQFVEKMQVPIVTTIMGKGAIPTTHPLYIGNCGMHGKYASNKAVSECDVLFSIGTRFNDRITGDLNEFAPKAKIVHIDVDTASISRNVVVDVPVVSDAKLALEHLLEWAEQKDTDAWRKQIKEWDEINPLEMRRDKGMTPQMIMEQINESFDEAIFVTDVGQNQMWATQYLDIDEKRQMITSGGLGTMGFGFPAAIGAKIGNRNTPVVCITGDGGFQMNIQEMATAAVQETPVIICLLNNYYLGMVRQMQQLFYGKRYEATCLRRRRSCPANCKGPNPGCPPYEPDFMQIAKSYGAHGILVEKEADIKAALEEAQTYQDAPTIIEFRISTDEIVLPMVKGGNPLSEMILK